MERFNRFLPRDTRVLDVVRVTINFSAKTTRDQIRHRYTFPSFMVGDWTDTIFISNGVWGAINVSLTRIIELRPNISASCPRTPQLHPRSLPQHVLLPQLHGREDPLHPQCHTVHALDRAAIPSRRRSRDGMTECGGGWAEFSTTPDTEDGLYRDGRGEGVWGWRRWRRVW